MNYIDRKQFEKISKEKIEKSQYLNLYSTMCRFNTLVAVKNAGSGHLGSSFSAMDIVVYLYLNELNVLKEGFKSPNRDIYFSSKGHDVPGLYSLFYSLGVLELDQLLKLRKIGGLDGHPDVGTRGIESNTGSLGMGISKGKGMVWAKKYNGNTGNVFVLTGDGEFQEGQIYESLQTTAHQKMNELIVIMDHNKLQTDMKVSDINDIENIEEKVSAFKWHVHRVNGHDFNEIAAVIQKAKKQTDKPKLIIADTIKGKGVSFMEDMEKVKFEGKMVYKWHSGAPDDTAFKMACDELVLKINKTAIELGIDQIEFSLLNTELKTVQSSVKEYVAEAFGNTLCEIAKKRKDIIVLDGDLSADCRIRNFETLFPNRFIENGIAEQDMVSMAGGLARSGMLPIVNTFSSFLAARANEQIYNNACEKTKIIYAAHFAGFIPAGPGKSHQSVRDISLFGSIPNMTIIQPCNSLETKQVVEYCIETASENCMIRLNIGPSPGTINLPIEYKLETGKGTVLVEGKSAVIFAYGAVLLHEVIEAAKILKNSGFSLRVVNHPFLNRFDAKYLMDVLEGVDTIFAVDDHYIHGGFGELLLSALVREKLLGIKEYYQLGLNELPVCGTPFEVLKYHRLDAHSIAKFILQKTKNSSALQMDKTINIYSEEAPQ